MNEQLRAAAVRLPSSTSNLGSGYDTFGIALDRYLKASFEPGSKEFAFFRDGTLAELEITKSEDLLMCAFMKIFNQRGVVPRGVLRATSDIPISGGLGSSAAAVLAGHDLALSVLNEPQDHKAAFAEAYDQDGHGENAAACLYGGFCAVVPSPNAPVIIPLNLSERVGFAYAAPPKGISTREARLVLPSKVEHLGAVRTIGRATALVRGFAQGDPDLIRIGAEDELHVPYRLPLINGAEAAIAASYAAGAWAATISGAGSGIIAICDPEKSQAISEAMHDEFQQANPSGQCVNFSATPDFDGLTRLT